MLFFSQGSTHSLPRIALLTLAVQASRAQAANADDTQAIGDRRITHSEPVMTVTAPQPAKQAGSKTRISAQELQNRGANNFGSVMRYQPLIAATGSSGGSTAGKSGFDRGGYTGYNIRGLESNRVGLDVDGTPLPDATGRSYASRAGVNTFGIGRDYIDPYLAGEVDIASGATAVDQPNTSMGGAVSFRSKSPDDYLRPGKTHSFAYQSDYDSADRGWHNGITAAAGDEMLSGLLVLSRRDGQQTRSNSDALAAWPANWHSTALMSSGIWQPNDRHRFSAVVDYYHKTHHTHYDAWDNAGSSVLGTAQQQSDTRRWGISLSDEYTPYNRWADSLITRLYWQQTQAHDNTLTPTDMSGVQRFFSDYNVDSWGAASQWNKALGRHELSAGLNARLQESERPFHQSPVPDAMSITMPPEADSRSYTLGGFVQDKIHFDLADRDAALIPGVRVMYQHTRPRNLSSLTRGSDVLDESEAARLYGQANSDTRLLPSLTLQYALTPDLLTYVQYKRGAQFPNASQLYGSWNLGSSYAGTRQYALIGNPDLDTETSNNLEWGLKGEVTPGISLNAALFYNSYKNFIAWTRYARASSPERFATVPDNIYTIYRAENRDKAFIWGGELSTEVNFGSWYQPVSGLSASFALGYSAGQAKSRYAGDRYVDLDSVAPVKAIVGLAWDDPAQRYGAAVTATFVKGKRAESTSRESYLNAGGDLGDSTTRYQRVPGYGMVDMTAWWQVSRNVKLSGGVYNLTDRQYRDYLSSREITERNAQDKADWALAVMPGRTFQLGVNVDF